MMRVFLILLSVCSLIGGGTSCRKHDYRQLVIHVPEMRNEACVRAIAPVFAKAPGVKRQDVSIDIPNRKITIVYDSLRLADKNLEFLVAGAGFEANGIPADSKAVAALPPECRR